MLLEAQLCWTGHVIRMDDSRIPRKLMYGELKLGSRKRGRPKLRYKDTLKSNIKLCGIQPRHLEAAAADRPVWRSPQCLAVVRDRLHRFSSSTQQTTDYSCVACRRLCASSFGLRSHAFPSLSAQTTSSSGHDGLPRRRRGCIERNSFFQIPSVLDRHARFPCFIQLNCVKIGITKN